MGIPFGDRLDVRHRNLLFHGGRNVRHCYVGSRRRKVTTGREHLAGPALRGEPSPPAGGGLPDARVGGRGADDAVQESWLRLSRADTGGVHNLRAWLTTVVARVCLDMLRSRTARRSGRCGDRGR
jgi:Sigma-70 region 2